MTTPFRRVARELRKRADGTSKPLLIEGGARATGGDDERAKPRDFFDETADPAARQPKPAAVTAFRRVIGQWEVICPHCGRRHWHNSLDVHVAPCGRGSYRVTDVPFNTGEHRDTIRKAR